MLRPTDRARAVGLPCHSGGLSPHAKAGMVAPAVCTIFQPGRLAFLEAPVRGLFSTANSRSALQGRPGRPAGSSPTVLGNQPGRGQAAPAGRDLGAPRTGPLHMSLIRAAAEDREVERIFVNAAIKRALCRDAGVNRAWLHKVRRGGITTITSTSAFAVQSTIPPTPCISGRRLGKRARLVVH